jgi:hypothetical protein
VSLASRGNLDILAESLHAVLRDLDLDLLPVDLSVQRVLNLEHLTRKTALELRLGKLLNGVGQLSDRVVNGSELLNQSHDGISRALACRENLLQHATMMARARCGCAS